MVGDGAGRLSALEADLAYCARRHAYQRTDDYLFAQLIPYIGSKRKLLPLIAEALARTQIDPARATIADLFAGSGVVSRMAKRLGYRVVANDWEPYAAAINGCAIALDTPALPPAIFDEINALAPLEGYVTRHFCPRRDDDPRPDRERCYYTRSNGMRIDSVRERIAQWERDGALSPAQRDYLLAPLIASASYVANTSGVFKAYHAGWGGATGTALYRIKSDLTLKPPRLLDTGRGCAATQRDASDLAARWSELSIGALDIAYLDPPYNQHPYGSNYHLLNTIAVWDKADVPSFEQAKSAIRTDWRSTRRSAYNRAADALPALLGLVDALPCRWAVLSYSTDGNIDLERLCGALSLRGALTCVAKPYKRYRVSAQRMSPRARNVEFVLILDRSASPNPSDSLQCIAQIAAIAGKL